MSESKQHVITRNRPPRVQITYDVETLGSIQKKELPFIVGILADLSGDNKSNAKRLKDRKFVEIDRDNFDEVMEKISPALDFKVANRLQSDSSADIKVSLKFSRLEDFNPNRVVEHIGPLKDLFEARRRLTDLLAKLDGNERLDELLNQVLSQTAEQGRLREALKLAGHDGAAAPAAAVEQKIEEGPLAAPNAAAPDTGTPDAGTPPEHSAE